MENASWKSYTVEAYVYSEVSLLISMRLYSQGHAYGNAATITLPQHSMHSAHLSNNAVTIRKTQVAFIKE